ncbi:hypothetical protein XANCAGTX0491_009502 [Xanthoria calcicola]
MENSLRARFQKVVNVTTAFPPLDSQEEGTRGAERDRKDPPPPPRKRSDDYSVPGYGGGSEFQASSAAHQPLSSWYPPYQNPQSPLQPHQYQQHSGYYPSSSAQHTSPAHQQSGFHPPHAFVGSPQQWNPAASGPPEAFVQHPYQSQPNSQTPQHIFPPPQSHSLPHSGAHYTQQPQAQSHYDSQPYNSHTQSASQSYPQAYSSHSGGPYVGPPSHGNSQQYTSSVGGSAGVAEQCIHGRIIGTRFQRRIHDGLDGTNTAISSGGPDDPSNDLYGWHV